jgi:hypothetical protein
MIILEIFTACTKENHPENYLKFKKEKKMSMIAILMHHSNYYTEWFFKWLPFDHFGFSSIFILFLTKTFMGSISIANLQLNFQS